MSAEVPASAESESPHLTEAAALTWAARRFAVLPIAGLLGARAVGCDPKHGRIKVEFQARRDFCNLMGSIQGGMLTAMLDLAMSFAALCTMDDAYVVPSLEVKTTFLVPARPGTLTGDGILLRRGKTIAFMEGRLVDAEGLLLATASATAQIRLRPPPAK